jgi:hypothetical protein
MGELLNRGPAGQTTMANHMLVTDFSAALNVATRNGIQFVSDEQQSAQSSSSRIDSNGEVVNSLRSLALCTIAVLLLACGSSGPVSHELNWLDDKPCKLPCFYGIQPGVTSAQEGLLAISQVPGVESARVSRNSTAFPAMGDSVLWRWKNVNWDSEAFTEGASGRQKIVMIRSIFSRALLFSEIRAKFGEPSDVIPSVSNSPDIGEKPVYSMFIVYRDLGLIMPVRNPNNNDVPRIDDQMTFDSIEIVETGPNGITRWKPGGESAAELLVPWQPGLSFDDYCRNAPSIIRRCP